MNIILIPAEALESVYSFQKEIEGWPWKGEENQKRERKKAQMKNEIKPTGNISELNSYTMLVSWLILGYHFILTGEAVD